MTIEDNFGDGKFAFVEIYFQTTVKNSLRFCFEVFVIKLIFYTNKVSDEWQRWWYAYYLDLV